MHVANFISPIYARVHTTATKINEAYRGTTAALLIEAFDFD